MEIKAGHIPFLPEEEIHYEGFPLGVNEEDVLLVPVLTEEQLELVARGVRKNAQSILKRYSVMEIVDVIDRTIQLLLDRTSSFRQAADNWLPKITGYDEKMVRLSLTSYLKTFRKKELLRFLTEDFSNWSVLDDFQPRAKGGFSKALAPNVITHIWAGNVPGIPIWSLIAGLLVKAGNIGKVSSAEPLFAGLFAQALAEIDGEMAKCFAIVWWRGGDEAKEKVIGEQADIVVGYGNNSSLESLRRRLPIRTRFIAYGHKVSFGVISRHSLQADKVKRLAADLAYDVMRFDQNGCYSPQTFFIQAGGKTSPQDFAEMLAGELLQLENRYPRRELSIEESSTLSQWKQAEEIMGLSHDDHVLYTDSQGKWAVSYGQKHTALNTPLNRSVNIASFDHIEEVIDRVAPLRDYLQTVGLACTPEELFDWASLLAEAGVTRFSSVGAMTYPEAGWHHDGRFNLLDLVNFVDIDSSAEDYSEQFASYID